MEITPYDAVMAIINQYSEDRSDCHSLDEPVGTDEVIELTEQLIDYLILKLPCEDSQYFVTQQAGKKSRESLGRIASKISKALQNRNKLKSPMNEKYIKVRFGKRNQTFEKLRLSKINLDMMDMKKGLLYETIFFGKHLVHLEISMGD